VFSAAVSATSSISSVLGSTASGTACSTTDVSSAETEVVSTAALIVYMRLYPNRWDLVNHN